MLIGTMKDIAAFSARRSGAFNEEKLHPGIDSSIMNHDREPLTQIQSAVMKEYSIFISALFLFAGQYVCQYM